MTYPQAIAAAFTAGWITALAAAAWIIHKTSKPQPKLGYCLRCGIPHDGPCLRGNR